MRNLIILTFILIKFVNSVTIDSQLTIIKNDCFERQAIGHRLKSSDIYKTFEVKTVPECQRECTKEEDICKTFSFGIGVKGNVSCELSKKVIRETAELKPIGTVLDEDFDLYIKKLGCKLVIEQKPSTEAALQSDEIPSTSISDTYGSNASNNNHKPSIGSPKPDYYGSNKPINHYEGTNSNSDSGSGYGHTSNSGSTFGNGLYNKPPKKPYGNVQTTLISVRPDPSRPGYTGLLSGYDKPEPSRPVNEPLNERPFYGESHNRPKPDSSYGSLSPYVNEIPRPSSNLYNGHDTYGEPARPSRPRPLKPEQLSMRPYENEIFYNKPEILNSPRPDFRPGLGYYRPIDPMMDEFRPHFDNLRPESWGGYERPDPMRDPINSYEYSGFNSMHGLGLGSYANRPMSQYDEIPRPSYDNRPGYDRDRPPRPERPQSFVRPTFDSNRPTRPDSGYGTNEMEFSRPDRPQYEYGNGRPDFKPEFDGRPQYTSGFYRPEHERPDFDRPRPGYEGPQPEYEKPRPVYEEPRPDYQKPRPGYDGPRPEYEKPRPSYEGSRPEYEKPRPGYEESRPEYEKPRPGYEPSSNFDRPIRPVFEERPDDRPGHRPNRPDYGPKPISAERPVFDQRPMKPSNSYEDSSRPYRPNWDKDVINRPYDSSNPNVNYDNVIKPVTEEEYGNRRHDTFANGYGVNNGSQQISIVSETLGPNGEKITSIITEIKPGESCSDCVIRRVEVINRKRIKYN